MLKLIDKAMDYRITFIVLALAATLVSEAVGIGPFLRDAGAEVLCCGQQEPAKATATEGVTSSISQVPPSKSLPSAMPAASPPQGKLPAGAATPPVGCVATATVALPTPADKATVTGTPDSLGYVSVPYSLDYNMTCSGQFATFCPFGYSYIVLGGGSPASQSCQRIDVTCGSQATRTMSGNWLLKPGTYTLKMFIKDSCMNPSVDYASSTTTFTVKAK